MRPASSAASAIAPRLLAWFHKHGRHDLPWQREPTPYRVWVSEVMLQQTQVGTVVPYYERFMSSFPALEDLAAAKLDAVLHLWTGLGYYARARNLHRAARILVEQHGGQVPQDIEVLQTLPGIGRSTAGAVLALSRGQRHPILDGNARRVLARYFGIEGHFGEPETARKLWEIADACTPQGDVAAYTQAIMDLGATLCSRSHPECDRCPLRDGCMARLESRQAELPGKRPPRARPHRESFALIVQAPYGAVLLEQRPPRGLWGGLLSFPMFGTRTESLTWLRESFGERSTRPKRLPPYEHAFTHFDLTLRPLLVRVDGSGCDSIPGHTWFDPANPPVAGLSKPASDLVALLAINMRLGGGLHSEHATRRGT